MISICEISLVRWWSTGTREAVVFPYQSMNQKELSLIWSTFAKKHYKIWNLEIRSFRIAEASSSIHVSRSFIEHLLPCAVVPGKSQLWKFYEHHRKTPVLKFVSAYFQTERIKFSCSSLNNWKCHVVTALSTQLFVPNHNLKKSEEVLKYYNKNITISNVFLIQNAL